MKTDQLQLKVYADTVEKDFSFVPDSPIILTAE